MKKIIIIICYIATVVTLCACSKAKGNITENITDKSIVLEYSSFTNKKAYELDITSKDELDVTIICESGELNLEIHNENNEKLYIGRIEESADFQVFCKGEKIYITVEGKNTTGSIQMIIN